MEWINLGDAAGGHRPLQDLEGHCRTLKATDRALQATAGHRGHYKTLQSTKLQDVTGHCRTPKAAAGHCEPLTAEAGHCREQSHCRALRLK